MQITIQAYIVTGVENNLNKSLQPLANWSVKATLGGELDKNTVDSGNPSFIVPSSIANTIRTRNSNTVYKITGAGISDNYYRLTDTTVNNSNQGTVTFTIDIMTTYQTKIRAFKVTTSRVTETDPYIPDPNLTLSTRKISTTVSGKNMQPGDELDCVIKVSNDGQSGQIVSVYGYGGNDVYALTPAQVRNLLNDLWNKDLGESLNQTFFGASSDNAIISAHGYPTSLITTAGSSVIRVGNVNVNATGKNIATLTGQTFTTGSLSLPSYYGNFLDMSPYTTISLYIPFYGWKELDSSLFCGGSVSVDYTCDPATGLGNGTLKGVTNSGSSVVIDSFQISVGIPIAFTANGAEGIQQMVGSMAGGAAMGAALAGITGGASLLAGAGVGALGKATSGVSNNQVANGSQSSANTYLADQTFKATITRPVPAHSHQMGVPSSRTTTLGSLSGYVEVASIHSGSNIPADHFSYIASILKSGVVV